jgi:hypothetical protein
MNNDPLIKFYSPKELASISEKDAIVQDLKLVRTWLLQGSSGILQAKRLLEQLIDELQK